jgi:hypothetical protein
MAHYSSLTSFNAYQFITFVQAKTYCCTKKNVAKWIHGFG